MATGSEGRRAARIETRSAAGACAVLLLCGLGGACSAGDRQASPSDLTNSERNGLGAGDGREPGNGGSAGSTGNAPRIVPDKLDLLLMIDNSISMSDKQEILRSAVPDLMSRLVNPVCLDASGNEFPAPAAGADCASGQHRQFVPIADVHVGIVSSSLGDIGANAACPDAAGAPRFIPDRADMGHLIGSLPRGQGTGVNASGFLEWHAGDDLEQFNASFQSMVGSVGENGCGWEASLEAWYRFLIDPSPQRGYTRVACDPSATTMDCLAPALDASGQPLLDQELLAQRAAFLRPDSLLAIVMLTDENDCSLEPAGTNWLVVAIDRAETMFRGTSACDADPNDKCCRSCGGASPDGCPPDPICDGVVAGIPASRLPTAADSVNLRCFDQKRRFGYDFLYPTQRYVNALRERQLCLEQSDLSTQHCPGELQPNPLFAGGRTPDQVMLAGIVGVPWQAISSSTGSNGQPLSNPEQQLRFKSSREFSDEDWKRIAGSPGTAWQPAWDGTPEIAAIPPAPPSEPTMLESSASRPNVRVGNPINGRDYDTTGGAVANSNRAEDLEYACIFPLPTARDCSQRNPQFDNCDCYQGNVDRPLCEATPGNGTPGTTQYWAKAYPGLRQLQVMRGLGPSSAVASICARNTTDPGRPDFGYRPAMTAIIEGLQPQLDAR